MREASLTLHRSEDIWIARDVWPAPHGSSVSVCFAGKGLPDGRKHAVERLVPPGVEPVWLHQIHSAIVHEARSGMCDGDGAQGDALVSGRKDLALSVVTADCVPVLLAGKQHIAAVHAGWRGVVAEIVAASARRLEESVEVAWIGPAIRGDAYEVSQEVADRVVAVSHPEVSRPGPRGRPLVDLPTAVAYQLRQAGVSEIRQVAGCTFTEADRLWSYRREAGDAGRNVSVIWRG